MPISIVRLNVSSSIFETVILLSLSNKTVINPALPRNVSIPNTTLFSGIKKTVTALISAPHINIITLLFSLFLPNEKQNPEI